MFESAQRKTSHGSSSPPAVWKVRDRLQTLCGTQHPAQHSFICLSRPASGRWKPRVPRIDTVSRKALQKPEGKRAPSLHGALTVARTRGYPPQTTTSRRLHKMKVVAWAYWHGHFSQCCKADTLQSDAAVYSRARHKGLTLRHWAGLHKRGCSQSTSLRRAIRYSMARREALFFKRWRAVLSQVRASVAVLHKAWARMRSRSTLQHSSIGVWWYQAGKSRPRS